MLREGKNIKYNASTTIRIKSKLWHDEPKGSGEYINVVHRDDSPYDNMIKFFLYIYIKNHCNKDAKLNLEEREKYKKLTIEMNNFERHMSIEESTVNRYTMVIKINELRIKAKHCA